MKILSTKFKGLKVIKHQIFKDKRGFLRVTHNKKKLKLFTSLQVTYIQEKKEIIKKQMDCFLGVITGGLN